MADRSNFTSSQQSYDSFYTGNMAPPTKDGRGGLVPTQQQRTTAPKKPDNSTLDKRVVKLVQVDPTTGLPVLVTPVLPSATPQTDARLPHGEPGYPDPDKGAGISQSQFAYGPNGYVISGNQAVRAADALAGQVPQQSVVVTRMLPQNPERLTRSPWVNPQARTQVAQTPMLPATITEEDPWGGIYGLRVAGAQPSQPGLVTGTPDGTPSQAPKTKATSVLPAKDHQAAYRAKRPITYTPRPENRTAGSGKEINGVDIAFMPKSVQDSSRWNTGY